MSAQQDNFALYHWAPTARRGQINRYGLRPGSLSSDRLWKPPYVCLADGPLLAWNLIGPYRPHIRDWDLWWTNGAAVFPYETIPCDNGDTREYRVYHRVYKRDLWLVGSRVNEHYQPSDLRS